MVVGRPPPSPESAATVKFLCSYGGRIFPRHPDCRLRYVGGETRLLSVPRSLQFSELLLKMGELCGTAVSLRCQLPAEDLDALVSITCDGDLANLIVEYDRAAVPKIRAFLSLPKLTPPSSLASSSSSGGGNVDSLQSHVFSNPAVAERCLHQFMAGRPKPPIMPPGPSSGKAAWKTPSHQLHVYDSALTDALSRIPFLSPCFEHRAKQPIDMLRTARKSEQRVQCSWELFRSSPDGWMDLFAAKGQRNGVRGVRSSEPKWALSQFMEINGNSTRGTVGINWRWRWRWRVSKDSLLPRQPASWFTNNSKSSGPDRESTSVQKVAPNV
ncbi:hypothetical protein MLD38_009402 [Melastoma candidum]|uniref:Uncharacterized protein n=1 Tax=Melastoma candidum TaxID=119954 RepID=A0ACB9S0H3_9MYRT|nr:hypothetical protein MLD38_009402 [Melastoma candidum]